MTQKLDLLPAAALKMERLILRPCPRQRSVRQVAVSRQSLRHVKCGTQKLNMNTNVGTPMAAAGTRAVSHAIARSAQAGAALAPSSLRIPVNKSTRAHLRATRSAELAAWQPALEAGRDSLARASLRAQVAQLTRDFRKESWVYGVLACVSAAAVGYAVWNSFHLFKNLPVVLKTVQQWLL